MIEVAQQPRRWVEEYHVDGFRFDLASVMCRDGKGQPLEAAPIVRAIAKDPVLSQVAASNPACTPASGSLCCQAGHGARAFR